jgi:hypothetical protein
MTQPRRRGGGARKPPSDGDEDRPPTLGNPDADPVRIHREYVERRLGGGAEPTPEEYARALAEWHKLPGAVSAPPGEVASADTAPQEEQEEQEEQEPPEPGGDNEGSP